MVDRWIGFLLDRVRDLGLEETTAIFFTTDHGTILGEHDRLHKSPETLIAPETRLPLIARLPNAQHAGTRVNSFLQSYDLLPTILDLLGVPQPDYVTGKSALPLLSASSATDANPSSAPSARSAPASTPTLRDHVISAYTDHCSFRTAQWNLLSAYDLDTHRLTGTPRLFDLETDPTESTDVAADHPGIVRALAERLQEHLST